MILADTSVWIDHLRSPDAAFVSALERAEVIVHPFIVGELACGYLRNRRELLTLWSNLPATPVATDEEALAFIERKKLMEIGLG